MKGTTNLYLEGGCVCYAAALKLTALCLMVLQIRTVLTGLNSTARTVIVHNSIEDNMVIFSRMSG